MADPWKHRSVGMLCASCMWFVEKVTEPRGFVVKDVKEPVLEPGEFRAVDDRTSKPGTFVIGGPNDDDVFGRCRRHAPTMQGYPAVFGNDWCGDHKLDENKR
ncbi:MAG: hypothetical protein H8E94_06530 [Alphaproteobacteria bacterium]|nr:hypothetical protein [Alphaproteobacteria bacterium]